MRRVDPQESITNMAAKILDSRRQSLEEQFFQASNAELLAKLRLSGERAKDKQALTEAMGLRDDELVDGLLDAGLSAQTWLAVSLVPLVEVAWADREISQAEISKILEAAAEKGLTMDGPVGELLDQWLATRPPPRLREAWKLYIESVCEVVGSDQIDWMRKDTLTRARDVAEATNHLLGFGNHVSDVEEVVLADLASAF